MVIVAGQIRIRADKRDEAIAAALVMATATQAEEGCIEYQFYSDISDPNTILVFERWETAEALKAHGQSAHMAAFRKVMPNVVAAPGDIYMYTGAEQHKL